MAEAVQWLPDGTPYSPRFGDIYRSCSGAQAQHVYLRGCGLPLAWAHQAQWRVLETGFGLGLNFLSTWQAWRTDPARPRLLHMASVEAWPVQAQDLLRSVADDPELNPLAQQLVAQWRGLLPGFHRLSFEQGQVLLTLCVGPVQAMLRELAFEADAVYLDGFSPACNPDMWSPDTLKAVARCCQKGAHLASYTVATAVRQSLQQLGFVVEKHPGLPPKRDCLRARFDPHWPLTRRRTAATAQAGNAIVVGAGIAGAAVAASLARRGWQVQVLDAATSPAQGASSLPAGLLAPQVSPDDNLLSRLSRRGLRMTQQEAQQRLRAGLDWAATGALEHRVDKGLGLPVDWPEAGLHGSTVADAAQHAACGLAPEHPALWHAQAAWIQPAKLVQAWLQQAGVHWRGGMAVQRVQRSDGGWQVWGAQGEPLAQADLLVIAAAHASARLWPPAQLPLQAVRGQVSWGWCEGDDAAALPPFPVHGHGSLLPAVPDGPRQRWLLGASFERDGSDTEGLARDHAQNWQRLARLLPAAAQHLQARFDRQAVHAWVGQRCAAPDRLPLVGPMPGNGPWLCTAFGSRGLSWVVLAAELLAARLHGEPLPVERRLAQALDAARFSRYPGPAP